MPTCQSAGSLQQYLKLPRRECSAPHSCSAVLKACCRLMQVRVVTFIIRLHSLTITLQPGAPVPRNHGSAVKPQCAEHGNGRASL